MTACPVCSRPFTGRSDKLFCSTRCRKRHHRRVQSMGRLTRSYLELADAEQAARLSGDFEAVHRCRLRAGRALAELRALSDDSVFQHTPLALQPLRALLTRIISRPASRPGQVVAGRHTRS